jgi:3-hydroxybutyryl-CoA dehydrogenase
MKILIIGGEQNLAEFQSKFGTTHEYSVIGEHYDAEKFLDAADVVFDFIIDEEPDQFEIYSNTTTPVFINTCKLSLGELTRLSNHHSTAPVFGFSGLPTFLNRSLLEVCMIDRGGEPTLKEICGKLGTDYLVVEDRVGLVTPRVISMIINEAFYAVQEGTATREDIDLAMKLGTNYPYGPFEWSERIGITHVYELLDALYQDTHDERYKICPLLKKEYLATL